MDFYKSKKELFLELKSYINENYIGDDKNDSLNGSNIFDLFSTTSEENQKKLSQDISQFINSNLSDNSFYDLLENHINNRINEKLYKSNSEVYTAAGYTKQQFSQMKTEPGYKPLKHTVISYAIVLHLNHDQTLELLSTAGFTLSNTSKYDLIINYFITNNKYDFYEINNALIDFNFTGSHELFGCCK